MIPGMNSFMFQGLSLNEIFDKTYRIGCRYLSVQIDHLFNKNLLELANKYHIKINAAGSLFLDVDTIDESVAYGKKIIDLCDKHKIPMLVIVLKSVAHGYKWMGNAVSLLKQLCEYAMEKEIVIGIEPLSDELRTVTCLTHLRTARILCDYVNQDNIGIIVDTFHCGSMNNLEDELESFALPIVGIHLSDKDLQGNACFPGDGVLPLKKWLNILSHGGRRVVTELEVVNNILLQKSYFDLKVFRDSFLRFSRVMVVGELAIHCFKNTNDEIENVFLGGGAGMISSQLSCLGDFPHLFAICGDDFWGDFIRDNYSEYVGWSEIIQQENGQTSVISISDEKVDIAAGNIDVNNIDSILSRTYEGVQYCYLPMFPGYDNIYLSLNEYKNINLICDFGYFQWCGNKDVLFNRISATKGGYCALINVKDLPYYEKEELLTCAIDTGFSYAIATDGDNNVLLADKFSIREYPVLAVQAIGSTCGAGDCMIAGILYMLGKGYSIEEALCFGIYVAYQKVQVLGVWEQTNRR